LERELLNLSNPEKSVVSAGKMFHILTIRTLKKLRLLWSCATEKKKLHGERNNARYYFWSKKKRKTKNMLVG